MKDLKLKFESEAQAKSVLSAFVVDDVLQTESQAGSLIIQGAITPYDNTDPENPVALPPLDGFFVFLRSRRHTNKYDAYLTDEPLFNVSFGPLPPPPQEVAMWAISAVLDMEGLTPQIETIFSQLPEPDKTIINRVWTKGNYVRRDSPMISALGTYLNKTAEQIDDYFWRASELYP